MGGAPVCLHDPTARLPAAVRLGRVPRARARRRPGGGGAALEQPCTQSEVIRAITIGVWSIFTAWTVESTPLLARLQHRTARAPGTR